jgi:hypothetical protein
MSKLDYDNRQQSVDQHDKPGHAHLVAEQNGKQVELGGHEQSRHAQEHEAHHYQSSQEAPSAHGITHFGHAEIEALAFELWQARGCPDGSSDEDWFNAARQLRSRAETTHRKV